MARENKSFAIGLSLTSMLLDFLGLFFCFKFITQEPVNF